MNTETESTESTTRTPCDILPDVKLVRFRGPDFVKLVAKRPGHDGCAPAVYEIDVRKNEKVAAIKVNERVIFTIEAKNTGSCMLEYVAISALHCFCMKRLQANKRSLRSRKRIKAEKKAKQ